MIRTQVLAVAQLRGGGLDRPRTGTMIDPDEAVDETRLRQRVESNEWGYRLLPVQIDAAELERPVQRRRNASYCRTLVPFEE